jgi:translation initiation factor 2B subunit (eIF-2B alpha/beta/delta family)
LEIQKQYQDLDKRYTELNDQYHMDKQRIRECEELLRQSIRKDDARRLQEHNENLQTELAETRAAMLSFKNMNETIADQVKGLKLMIERRKDENENLVNVVRELSSQSDEQKRLGKLYYLVMLSRW